MRNATFNVCRYIDLHFVSKGHNDLFVYEIEHSWWTQNWTLMFEHKSSSSNLGTSLPQNIL